MPDFASRLRSVEKKLEWIMTTMRMRAVVSSGLLDTKGQPIPTQAFEGTMEELYHMSRTLKTVKEDEAESPPIAGNGGLNDAH